MIKICAVCEAAFEAQTTKKTCSEECRKEKARRTNIIACHRWREENDEKYRKATRRWRLENKQKSGERQRKWREENPEKHRQSARQYARDAYDRKTGKSGDALFFQMMESTKAISEVAETTK